MKVVSTAIAPLLWIVSMSSRISEIETEKRSIAEHSADLISWLHSFPSGYVSPKVELRHLDENDPTSSFGAFATDDMDMDELILTVPHQMLIDSRREGNPDTDANACGLVRNLIEQFELGEESKYWTYTRYLNETQPHDMLPSAWSDEGKKLLMKMLGDHEFEFDEWIERYHNEKSVDTNHEFPPLFVISWTEKLWYRHCDGDEDPLSEYAALLVVQCAWDDVLIPIFDMFSHRNGHWLNTKSNNIVAGSDVVVRAKRNIKTGEQLYISQNMCEDCGNRLDKYGTPELFRDYGFVEQFPQSWTFTNLDIAFRIDEVYDEKAKEKSLVITEWIKNEPSIKQRDEIEKALKDLQMNKEMYLNDRSQWENVSDNEWLLIEEYTDAMQVALNLVIEFIIDLDLQDTCVIDRSCDVSLKRYDDLTEHFVTYSEYYDDAFYDFAENFRRFDYYDSVELVKSQYQEINFMHSEKYDDLCLDLDDIIQICTQYRPHYHELFVHYPARFLPVDSLKRVVFVGGGDSMLLHEILKYDSIEKVVGLEIDQMVVRGSFKHFGTQPHFEDPRVEWWFGDASKSILLLPKDYFGSFDLVLIDLSETVTSFKVTDSLDVLEALTLLMKDDGVFVKNEAYHQEFSAMFEFSALVVLYGTPILGAQVMTMGSRTIDFMRVDIVDHFSPINPNLLIRPVVEIQSKYELFHDYAHNITSLSVCDINESSLENAKEDNQLRSPGIIFIAEAEDVSIQLNDSDFVRMIIVDAMKECGLEIFSDHFSSSIAGDIFTFLTNAGYVIARTGRDISYVGLDIHFWTMFQLQNQVANFILEALGSEVTSTTTYRVIAGGIFNVKSWEEDALMNGPHVEDSCNDYIKTGEITERDIEKPNIERNLLIESLKIVAGNNIRLLVLTGSDLNLFSDKDRRFVMSESRVAEIVTLNCPSLKNFDRNIEGETQALVDCESLLYKSILYHARNGKFNAIFIDSSADEVVSSIFLKCFTMRSGTLRDEVLVNKSLIISLKLTRSGTWRQNLLRRFKSNIFKESPASYAEVLVQKNDTAGRLLLTNGFDRGFVSKLNRAVSIMNTSDLSAKVDVINGAEWRYQDPFIPHGIAKMTDYDSTESLAQWDSQNHVGHQVILQMESKRNLSKTTIERSFATTIGNLDIIEDCKDAIRKFDELGDGLVLMVSWRLGNIVLLWDGRMHIDINIFTFFEDLEFVGTIQEAFEKDFGEGILVLTLRDEQPRGVGKMVLYKRDFGFEPIWSNID